MAQSQKEFKNYELLTVQIDKIFLPNGGARGAAVGRPGMEKISHQLMKRSIILTQDFMAPEDKTCLAVGIALGILHAQEQTPPKKTAQFRHKRARFTQRIGREVARLCNLSGIDFNALPTLAGEREFLKLQQILSSYSYVPSAAAETGPNRKVFTFRLVIFNALGEPIFTGDCGENEGPNVINLDLLFQSNHFNFIKSRTGAFSKRYFCSYCHAGYNSRTSHRNCIYTCNFCFSSPPCHLINGGVEEQTPCGDCNRSFFNTSCFTQHKANGVCSQHKFCNLCTR